jgi:hypothetical protein
MGWSGPGAVIDNRPASEREAEAQLRRKVEAERAEQRLWRDANGLARTTNMATMLGHPVPPHVDGRYMPRWDIFGTAIAMYRTFGNVDDPYAECYYLLALQAKRAAASARATTAALVPSASPTTAAASNPLDAVAMLTSLAADVAKAARKTDQAASSDRTAAGGSRAGSGKSAAAAPVAIPAGVDTVDAAVVSAVTQALPPTALKRSTRMQERETR